MAIMKILVGIPASGKSTYSREFVSGKSDKWVIVNRDSIRNMLGDYWIPSREKLVTSIERDSIETALLSGFNVIVDATNFNSTALTILADICKADVEYKYFDIDVEEAIDRDSKRRGSAHVGEEVIRRFYERYVKIRQ